MRLADLLKSNRTMISQSMEGTAWALWKVNCFQMKVVIGSSGGGKMASFTPQPAAGTDEVYGCTFPLANPLVAHRPIFPVHNLPFLKRKERNTTYKEKVKGKIKSQQQQKS